MNYEKDISRFWGDQWLTQTEGLVIDSASTRFKFRHCIKPILDQLPPKAKVCEIGSGNCQWLSLIRAYRPDLDLHGIDLSEIAKEFAARFGISFFQADIRSLSLPDGFFDFTFSWGVIEHMLESDLAFKEQYRVSKSFVVADVPCSRSLGALLINRAKKARNLSDYEAMIEFGRIFKPTDFKTLIQKVCSKEDRVSFFNNFTVIPQKKFQNFDLGSFLDGFIPSWVRKRAGQNIGTLIQKQIINHK